MVNGTEEIGVRGSVCASVFIVGAGAPGGVKAPCPKAEGGRMNTVTATTSAAAIDIKKV